MNEGVEELLERIERALLRSAKRITTNGEAVELEDALICLARLHSHFDPEAATAADFPSSL